MTHLTVNLVRLTAIWRVKWPVQCKDQIHSLIESAEQAVLPKLDEVRQTAKSEMQQKLNSELERLLALKAVNPNIRDEEISAIETQIETLSGYIETAQLQLDSLRLIVVAHQ